MRISYDCLETSSIIYQTNLYGGADADIAGTQLYTDNIDMSMVTDALVDFLFDASDATDDLLLYIYKRGDSTWVGTEIAWKSVLTVDNDGTSHTYHYTIPKDYRGGHYRFGMVRSGVTTTFDIQVTVHTFRETTGVA